MNDKVSMMVACVAAVMGLSSCAGPEKGYTIEGELAGVENGTVYLSEYLDKAYTVCDSAAVAGGKFRFTGRTPEAVACGLSTKRDDKHPLPFFLTNEHLSVKLNESVRNITVRGSLTNRLYFTNEPLASGTVGFRIDSMINQHPASPVGPFLLVKYFSRDLKLDELRKIRSRLDPSLDGSVYVNRMDSLISRRENMQVGHVAPDFTLPDAEGRPVSLSSFRGKYVWVNFWASWSSRAHRDNPLLSDAYKRFRDKDFDIVGVSIDRNEDAWQKAVRRDSLVWTQVADLHSWQADIVDLYAIQKVPTGYLIDPQGVIVAADTNAKNLMDKLEEVMGEAEAQ